MMGFEFQYGGGSGLSAVDLVRSRSDAVVGNLLFLFDVSSNIARINQIYYGVIPWRPSADVTVRYVEDGGIIIMMKVHGSMYPPLFLHARRVDGGYTLRLSDDSYRHPVFSLIHSLAVDPEGTVRRVLRNYYIHLISMYRSCSECKYYLDAIEYVEGLYINLFGEAPEVDEDSIEKAIEIRNLLYRAIEKMHEVVIDGLSKLSMQLQNRDVDSININASVNVDGKRIVVQVYIDGDRRFEYIVEYGSTPVLYILVNQGALQRLSVACHECLDESIDALNTVVNNIDRFTTAVLGTIGIVDGYIASRQVQSGIRSRDLDMVRKTVEKRIRETLDRWRTVDMYDIAPPNLNSLDISVGYRHKKHSISYSIGYVRNPDAVHIFTSGGLYIPTSKIRGAYIYTHISGRRAGAVETSHNIYIDRSAPRSPLHTMVVNISNLNDPQNMRRMLSDIYMEIAALFGMGREDVYKK